ncbi:MAG: dihydrodipicolinate synthase family protein [Hyphomicrobiaceae bacterium]
MHTGIQAILFAMFSADETLDRAAMKKQAELSIAAGVSAVGALGLATEVSKLSERERRTVIDWVTEDVAGRLPTYFTIYGNSVAEQIDQVRHCERAKAAYVILQPPAVGAFAGAEYIRYFGRVADATSLPVAIQNAPAYMGRGLVAAEICDLVTQHPNVKLLKGEGPVVDIKGVIEATEDRIPVLNGRGGLELTDNWRAGCTGMILAPDTIDRSVKIWAALEVGREAEAERMYEEVLPTIVFIMQSVESLICYGKRVFAARAGLTVHDRGPALRPSAMGLKLVERHAKRLGMLAGA